MAWQYLVYNGAAEGKQSVTKNEIVGNRSRHSAELVFFAPDFWPLPLFSPQGFRVFRFFRGFPLLNQKMENHERPSAAFARNQEEGKKIKGQKNRRSKYRSANSRESIFLPQIFFPIRR